MAELAMFGLMSVIQMAQAGMTLKSDINNEIARQQGICDQLTDVTNVQIPFIHGLNSSVDKATALSKETQQHIADLADSILATTNNINVLKKQADTKILIQIVVNVIIVSMVALYIINKKSS